MTKGGKYVVVGGAGFIGSHIVDELVEKGCDVHVIDNLSGGKKEHVNKDATLHVVDIRELKDIRSIIDGAEGLFHLAALPRVQVSIENPIETHNVNVTGMLNVLLSARDGGVKRVVYSASSSAYGDQDTLPLTETMLPNPMSPYALHKLMGEYQCKVFSLIHDIETVSLRYFNVYGPRFDPEGAYALVIGKFIKQKSEGKPLTITGDGKQTRDFTHISDVVRANLLAMEGSKVGKGEVMNIGAGNNTSINRIAELIGGPVEYIDARLEPHDTLADTTRAKELIGWGPKVTIEDGVRALMEEGE